MAACSIPKATIVSQLAVTAGWFTLCNSDMATGCLVGGWPTPLKNDGVKVSWDDEIPNWMESHNPAMFQTTNQLYIHTYIYI